MTARPTARWAGPNICTACLAPFMVTLLNIMVLGFAGTLGETTASRLVKPSLLLTRPLQNAVSAAEPARAQNQIDVGNLVAVSDQ